MAVIPQQLMQAVVPPLRLKSTLVSFQIYRGVIIKTVSPHMHVCMRHVCYHILSNMFERRDFVM